MWRGSIFQERILERNNSIKKPFLRVAFNMSQFIKDIFQKLSSDKRQETKEQDIESGRIVIHTGNFLLMQLKVKGQSLDYKTTPTIMTEVLKLCPKEVFFLPFFKEFYPVDL